MKIVSVFIVAFFYLTSSFAQSDFMQGLMAFEGDAVTVPNDEVAAEQFEKAFMEQKNLLAGLYLQHMVEKKLLVIPLKDSVTERLTHLKKLNLDGPFQRHGGVSVRNGANNFRGGQVKVVKKWLKVSESGRGGRFAYFNARFYAGNTEKNKIITFQGEKETSGIEGMVRAIAVGDMDLCPEFIQHFPHFLKDKKSYDTNPEIGFMSELAVQFRDKPINTDGATEYTYSQSILADRQGLFTKFHCVELKTKTAEALLRHAALLGHPQALKEFMFKHCIEANIPDWCFLHMLLKALRMEGDHNVEAKHGQCHHVLLPSVNALKSLSVFPEEDESYKAFKLLACVFDKVHDHLFILGRTADKVRQDEVALKMFMPKVEALITADGQPAVVDCARLLSACYHNLQNDNQGAMKMLKARLESFGFRRENQRGDSYLFACFLEAASTYVLKAEGVIKSVSSVARNVMHACKDLSESTYVDLKSVSSINLFVDEAPLYGPIQEEKALKLWKYVATEYENLKHPRVIIRMGNILRQYPHFLDERGHRTISETLLRRYLQLNHRYQSEIETDDILSPKSTYALLTPSEAQATMKDAYDPSLDYYASTIDGGETRISKPKLEDQVGECLAKLSPVLQTTLFKRVALEHAVHGGCNDTYNTVYDILIRDLMSKRLADRDLIMKYGDIFSKMDLPYQAFSIYQYLTVRLNDFEGTLKLLDLMNSQDKKKKMMKLGLDQENYDAVYETVLNVLSSQCELLASVFHLLKKTELDVVCDPIEDSYGEYLGENTSQVDIYALDVLLRHAETSAFTNLVLFEMLSGDLSSLLIKNVDLATEHLQKAADLGLSEASLIIKRTEWAKRSKEIEAQTCRNPRKMKSVGNKNAENLAPNSGGSSACSTTDVETPRVPLQLSKRNFQTWESLVGKENVKIADLKRFLGSLGDVKNGSGSRIKVSLGEARIHLHNQHNDLHGTTLEKGRQKAIVQEIQQHVDVQERPKS